MSKELEALNRIDKNGVFVSEEYNIVKSALERKDQLEIENAELKARNEKLEKALSIYKNKMVNSHFVKFYKSVKGYNANRLKTCYMYDELTEEEFYLLKEMLK